MIVAHHTHTHTPPSYLRSNIFVAGKGLTLSALQAVELWGLCMYAYTHTHFPHPWIWSLHMFALCTYPSKPKYTLRHKHTPSPHQSIPMLLQLSIPVELYYLSISPNGWIIHYNSRNDNQLCVINMEYHTHHTKPTTPCTYLSFGTYAHQEMKSTCCCVVNSKSPWHTPQSIVEELLHSTTSIVVVVVVVVTTPNTVAETHQ